VANVGTLNLGCPSTLTASTGSIVLVTFDVGATQLTCIDQRALASRLPTPNVSAVVVNGSDINLLVTNATDSEILTLPIASSADPLHRAPARINTRYGAMANLGDEIVVAGTRVDAGHVVVVVDRFASTEVLPNASLLSFDLGAVTGLAVVSADVGGLDLEPKAPVAYVVGSIALVNNVRVAYALGTTFANDPHTPVALVFRAEDTLAGTSQRLRARGAVFDTTTGHISVLLRADSDILANAGHVSANTVLRVLRDGTTLTTATVPVGVDVVRLEDTTFALNFIDAQGILSDSSDQPTAIAHNGPSEFVVGSFSSCMGGTLSIDATCSAGLAADGVDGVLLQALP
jgi:hypothetical protein